MKNLNIHKISSIIIYILILILIFLVSSTFYKSYARKNPKIAPYNSIGVSPFTGETLKAVQATNNFNYLKYNTRDLLNLSYITSSDITYGFYDESKDNLSYGAIFFNKDISKADDITSISSIPLNYSPQLIFNTSTTDDKNEANKPSFIFSNSCSLNFTLCDNRYVYLDSNLKKTKLAYDNIIFEFVDNVKDFSDYPYLITEKKEGIILNSGSKKEIYLENSKIILKSNKLPLQLKKGTTLWIFTTKRPNSL